MRSSENTFLARMGFADPDKKTSRHDLACAYLARPDVQEKLLSSVFQKNAETKIKESPLWAEFPRGTVYSQGTLIARTNANAAAVSVEHLVQGTRQGSLCFLDVLIRGWITYSCVMTFPSYTRPLNNNTLQDLFEREGFKWDLLEQTEKIEKVKINDIPIPVVLGVEVKTHNNPIGEALKQIKYYRQVLPADAWILVTDFDIYDVEKETLDRENIAHAGLGLEFDTYVREQMKKLNVPTITL